MDLGSKAAHIESSLLPFVMLQAQFYERSKSRYAANDKKGD